MSQRIDWEDRTEPVQITIGVGVDNGETTFYLHPESSMISGYFDPDDGAFLVALLRDVADGVLARMKRGDA